MKQKYERVSEPSSMLVSWIGKRRRCFALMGKGADVGFIEEVWGTFCRDGRLAGLGEELGVIAILVVDRRQHPGGDTNEFGVCGGQIHRDEDAVLLLLR